MRGMQLASKVYVSGIYIIADVNGSEVDLTVALKDAGLFVVPIYEAAVGQALLDSVDDFKAKLKALASQAVDLGKSVSSLEGNIVALGDDLDDVLMDAKEPENAG